MSPQAERRALHWISPVLTLTALSEAASADVSYMCGDFRRRLNATRGAHESPAPASASAAAAEAAAMAVAGASGVNSVDAAVPRLGSGAYFDAEKMDAAFASSPFRASSLIDRGAALQSAASRAQRDAAVQDSLLWLKGREAHTPLRAPVSPAAAARMSRSPGATAADAVTRDAEEMTARLRALVGADGATPRGGWASHAAGGLVGRGGGGGAEGVGPESPFAKVAQNLKRLQAGFSELAWPAAE